jgi:hypothetical protein
MEEARNAGITWPSLSDDVDEFLSDCICSLTKANRRRVKGWGNSKALEILRDPNSYALDLYTWKNKVYLSILSLVTDKFWSILIEDHSSDAVVGALMSWSEAYNFNLSKLVFLTDRGEEFVPLRPLVAAHVKTAAYSPESNCAIELKHKELGALCRTYSLPPDEVCLYLDTDHQKMVNLAIGGAQIGDLVLKWERRIKAKDADRWTGPYVVCELLGDRMMRARSLATGRFVTLHVKNSKLYERPVTTAWRTDQTLLERAMEELGVRIEDFEVIQDVSQSPWKGKDLFADINLSADIGEILRKCVNDEARSLLIVIPEWPERSFWPLHEALAGDFVPIEGVFKEGDSVLGQRIWDSFIGLDWFSKDDKKLLVDKELGEVLNSDVLELPVNLEGLEEFADESS